MKKDNSQAPKLHENGGASGNEPGGATEAPPIVLRPEDMAYSRRSKELNEIVARARDTRRQELVDNGYNPDETTNVDEAAESRERTADAAADAAADEAARTREEQEEEAAAPAAPAATPAAQPPSTPAAPAASTRKFVIDGEEREFTEEQIRAYVQKGAFADEKLEKANRLFEQATALMSAASAQPAPSAATSAADVRADDPPVMTRERAAELTRAIQYGSEDEATNAIMELTGQGRDTAKRTATRAQGLAPDQLDAYVTRAVQERLDLNKAVALLDVPPEQGGYSDLWSDPLWKELFIARDNAIVDAARAANKAAPPYAERMKSIATALRAERDRLSPKTDNPPPTPTLHSREVRKAEAPVTVRGGTARVPAAPAGANAQPKSRQQILEGMRASRGQDRI